MTATAPPAYLFDLDGTLVDSAPDLAVAVNHTLTTFDYQPISVAKVRQRVGKGGKVLLTEAFAAAGVEQLPETALPIFIEHYQQHIADLSTLYPGVLDTLTALHQAGHPLAVVTNKYLWLAVPLLEALGLAPLFATVVGSTCAANPKPHPDPVLLACQRLATAPAQAVMVGDSYHDEAAASAAGTDYYQVTYGYADHSLRPAQAAPPAYIDSLAQLL